MNIRQIALSVLASIGLASCATDFNKQVGQATFDQVKKHRDVGGVISQKTLPNGHTVTQFACGFYGGVCYYYSPSGIMTSANPLAGESYNAINAYEMEFDKRGYLLSSKVVIVRIPQVDAYRPKL